MRHWLLAASLLILVGNLTDSAVAQRLRRRAPAPAAAKVSLFDGQSLAGWVTAKGEAINDGWEVVDGALHLKGRSQSIYSEREYTNFILDFEWKIAEGGNSGIKYRVRSYDGALRGLEYQLLDDAKHKYEPDHIGSTGSIYALYEPQANKPLKPIGEFNHSRIVVLGNRLEHWLNGVKIASAVVGSREWYQRVAASKFNKRTDFAENASGKLMLQDHGHPTWFRSITIQELSPPRSRRLPGLLRR